MKIIVAGASGLIGRAVVAALRRPGNDVRRLVRNEDRSRDAIPWNPASHALDAAALEGVDAVINLAGENISAERWTAARREQLLSSRVDSTSTIVSALARARLTNAVLVNASAVGCYGERGDALLDETTPFGNGFLAEICRAWETEAMAANRFGIRTVCLRFGIVLAREGGALRKMLPLFRLGMGGRLGSGRQWMSWVHRDDVVQIIEHALMDSRCEGGLNVVAPGVVTNLEFAQTIGRVLHRPAVLPAPAWALRLALGQMADEALLASTRAVPAKLQRLGYEFRFPLLEPALRSTAV